MEGNRYGEERMICPCCSTPRKPKEMALYDDVWECGCGYAILDNEKSK